MIEHPRELINQSLKSLFKPNIKCPGSARIPEERTYNTMKFTLVSTVFNEANRLDQTIADLTAQTLQPSEIIITDAGSKDGTFEKLINWKDSSRVPIVILQKIGCNVAEGRNMAIRAAKYDLIASTDFGCRFHPQWLESLMEPFADAKVKAVGGGFTVMEDELKTLPAKAAFILFNGYRDDIHEPWFTPTSRSIAYYKEVFDLVGGYCEWLTLAADDTVFGRVAKKAGIKFYMVDKPYVYWGRHSTATAYAKEAYRYGLGDGESRINFRSAVSKFIELTMRILAVLLVMTILTTSIARTYDGNLLLLFLPLLPGFRSYVRFTKSWLRFRSAKYNFKVYLYGLILLEKTRLSYLKGYFQGYFLAPDFRKAGARKLKELIAG